MNILFIAQNLYVGGIQKALLNTLKELSKYECEIELFLFGGGELKEELPSNVKVIEGKKILKLISTPLSKVIESKNINDIILRLLSTIIVRITGSKKMYKFLFNIERKLDKYDVAISYFNDVPNNYFNQGTNQFLNSNVKANKKIAWIHTDPEKVGFNAEYCREIYKDIDLIVCVSNACMEKMKRIVPEFKDKLRVIYNCFPKDEIIKKSKDYTPEYDKKVVNIVTVARIDNSSKRIDSIIRVCKMLKENGVQNYKWTIVGDGPDLEKNIQLSNELMVNEYIDFIGNRTNPYPYIYNSDLFVLTSAYEGYPMVVCEALLLSTPVLTTNYSAAREQIDNKVNGIIVEMDENDIYIKLKELLDNRFKIEELKFNLLNNEFSNNAEEQLLNILGVN